MVHGTGVDDWCVLEEPVDPPSLSAPPNGPQPMTALFATKNLADSCADQPQSCHQRYFDHQNVYADRPGGDRPTVPPTTTKCIPVNSLPFGSFHPGGVNFCNGDGSVRWMADEIDIETYLALGSGNGDETVSE